MAYQDIINILCAQDYEHNKVQKILEGTKQI